MVEGAKGLSAFVPLQGEVPKGMGAGRRVFPTRIMNDELGKWLQTIYIPAQRQRLGCKNLYFAFFPLQGEVPKGMGVGQRVFLTTDKNY
jgi:hypothetical protein